VADQQPDPAAAGTSGPRRRLGTEERREQLLSVGAALFAEQPYDEVLVEQVAGVAGVSRGLLYHYFPTKSHFFAAVVRRESDRMLRRTLAVPGVPLADQLDAGLETYLSYASSHAHGFRAFHSAAANGDPVIRQAYQDGLAAQERQILDALAADPATAAELPLLRLAVRGWLAFTVAVCLDWLDHPELPRDRVRSVCADALLGALRLRS
jgi:AcrR family transcriptional regulator